MRSNGIYCYIDTKDNSIVYVGKDSHIHRRMRHYRHIAPSSYDAQPINRVLQNNKGRYKYKVLKQGNFKENLLNALEIIYIRRYNPKFNFRIGGEGRRGCSPWNKGKTNVYSEETLKRMSESLKGRTSWWKGKHHSEETKEKIRQVNLGKKMSDDSKVKLSHSLRETANSIDYRLNRCKHTKTGIFRLSKENHAKTRNGIVWRYKWRKNGKQHRFTSVSLMKLKQKVLENGLEWIIMDKTKYRKCIKEAMRNGSV